MMIRSFLIVAVALAFASLGGTSVYAQGITVNEAQQLRTLIAAALENDQHARVLDYALALIDDGYVTDDVADAMAEALQGLGSADAEQLVAAVLSTDAEAELISAGVARVVNVELVDMPPEWRDSATEALGALAMDQFETAMEIDDRPLLLRLRDALGGLMEQRNDGNTVTFRLLWLGQNLPTELAVAIFGQELTLDVDSAGRATLAFRVGSLVIPRVSNSRMRFYLGADTSGDELEPGTYSVGAGNLTVTVDAGLPSRAATVTYEVDVPVLGEATVPLPSLLALNRPGNCENAQIVGLHDADSVAHDVYRVVSLAPTRAAFCCEGYLPVRFDVSPAEPGEMQFATITREALVPTQASRSATRARRLRRWGAVLAGVGGAEIVYGAQQFGTASSARGAFSAESDPLRASAILDDVSRYERRGRLSLSAGAISVGAGAAMILAGSLRGASDAAPACEP